MTAASQDWKLECCHAADNIEGVPEWDTPIKGFHKSTEHFRAKAADSNFWFAFLPLADTFTQCDI